MNNITKTIMESLEQEKLNNNVSHIHYADSPEEAIEHPKSHLLQSQIKVIEAVIENLEKAKQDPYAIREKVFKEDEYWDEEKRWDNATDVGTFAFPHNNALEDQISSLNETLEELKKSL